MKYKSRKGWYRLVHPEKFIKPLDGYMKSFDGTRVEYKSALELSAFRYFDFNPVVKKWSLEPFGIPYVSPLDGKVHRYYIDAFVEFISGDKFLVEIKCEAETKKPTKPRSPRQVPGYQDKLKTYATNAAKWKQAHSFCEKQGLKFLILTEKVLN